MSEDFFLINGPLGDQEPQDNEENDDAGKNDNDDNGSMGCGVVIFVIMAMLLLAKCLF